MKDDTKYVTKSKRITPWTGKSFILHRKRAIIAQRKGRNADIKGHDYLKYTLSLDRNFWRYVVSVGRQLPIVFLTDANNDYLAFGYLAFDHAGSILI